MVKFAFRTTPETKKKLLELAKKRGVSLSEVVRCIFSEHFNEREAGGPVVQSGMKD